MKICIGRNVLCTSPITYYHLKKNFFSLPSQNRSCWLIAICKSILYCLQMPGVHVPRPNPSMDEFSRIILDFFWNFSSSQHDPEFEPVVDAFINQYMKPEQQASEADPGNPELHPKARMFESKLVLERLAGQFNSVVINQQSRRLRRPVVILPNRMMNQFHIHMRTKKMYANCRSCGASASNNDSYQDETVGILDISLFDCPARDVGGIIEWYLNEEFFTNQIHCTVTHCRSPQVQESQQIQIINHPEFIQVGLNRLGQRVPIGGSIAINNFIYDCIAAVQHSTPTAGPYGGSEGGHYS